jgi:hypothetical protein
LFAPGAAAAAPSFVGVALGFVLGFFEPLVFWRRCSTTAGAFALGLAGAGTSVVSAGAVAVGPGDGAVVGVVDGAGVVAVGVDVVVSVLVASVLGGSSAVVVVTVPSPLEGGLSVASAPAAIGPRPAAVMPLPASAEASARHTHRRVRTWGVMRRACSSFADPIGRGRRGDPTGAGTPTGIHIGRQAPRGKGFVIVSRRGARIDAVRRAART